ncbi:O-antigen ligase family protein [Intestinirhabdus alba]|jgi:O-antigen ligase|uniref:O-antigen ligase family protein n=1 Tax=Intestinirhabdus alba TaxID=2899544 RepID=A0A6L6II20_9ENTR|nr:O-antigen ligase family protein [Intestinirhabdus alba]MTH45527.1 O-antigen ligase family protein [Intestinirhabdus alba]
MPALHRSEPWTLYCQKSSTALEMVTYVLCFATMLVALIDNNLAMKLYTITAIAGLLALLLRGKPRSFSSQHWLLPLAILIVGAVDLIWYSAFKVDHSPFRATYHGYLNTAKIFLFGTFLTLLVLSSKIRLNRETPFYILYAVSFIIAGYAYSVKTATGLERIDFGIGSATGAAYSIMLVGIISAVSILYTRRNHPLLFLLNIIAVYYALMLTQTRSTLLMFPIICAIALTSSYLKSPKKLFFSVVGFFILLVALVALFSKPIYHRYHEGLADFTNYSSNNNSHSSLGARLAMYEIGFDIFREAPLAFRSADERGARMQALATEHPYLQGALEFSNVHLHNEFIEAASLKGLAGILSTLLFYIALFFTVYRHRSLGLFALTLAVIGTGLSDVIIWSRSIPIIMITGIVLILFIKTNRTDRAIS